MKLIKPAIVLSAVMLVFGIVNAIIIYPDIRPHGQAFLTVVIPLGFAALGTFVILAFLISKGMLVIAGMHEAEYDNEEYERRFLVEQLYTDNHHNDDFLNGVAQATEFLIENYLTEENAGPTELTWLGYFWNNYFPKEEYTIESYRAYMIYALMHRMDITDEEYEKIGKLMKSTTAKQVLGETFYHRFLFQKYLKEARQMNYETPTRNEKA